MVICFLYDASSCTVFNRENESRKDYEKHELGKLVIDLEPLHLGRELRWVNKKIKRLGYTESQAQKVCEQVAHGLVAKEHFCVEIYK